MASGNSGFTDNQSDASGRRARLRPKPAAMQKILNSNLLAPIWATNGMVFPYQPDVQYSQDVEYSQVDMVHTNQEFYAYKKTPAVRLTCAGDFTVQNQAEGLYALACIHFLRTVTKMYFGASPNAGTPPPILLFDAFGMYMFNALPVIVTQFQANMPKDIDYVPIKISNIGKPLNVLQYSYQMSSLAGMFQRPYNPKEQVIWLPAIFTISVSMTVQNTPNKLRSFNLEEFRSGDLLKGGGWL